MNHVPQSPNGNAMQPTCTECGSLLQTGWSNTSPKRMILMPCGTCAAKAKAIDDAIPKCTHCGGTGRAPAAKPEGT
jgi:hypothetical protein